MQNLALQDAVARLNERERQIIRMRFYEGRPRWRLPGKSASRRRRSAGWKSPPCALCGIISPTSGNARRSLNFCKLQPVIRRRHSIVFPEHTGIVKRIFKSARQRRLFDRHPHLQQLF